MQFPPVHGTDTIFEGTKTFWKTRVNLDLVIAYHAKSHCIEVIAHHPELGRECRLHLSSILMLSKMDQNDLALRIGEKKEVFIKQKKPVNVQQLTKEVLYTSMTNYIQSRLAYTVAEEEPLFQISLQVLMGDTAVADANGEMRLDVLIPPPASLDPVVTRFQKRIRLVCIPTSKSAVLLL
jgi:hypothetical protein